MADDVVGDRFEVLYNPLPDLPKPARYCVGDVVRLRSAGIRATWWAMTVADGGIDDDHILCLWHDQHGALQQASLPCAALEHVPEAER